MQILEFREFEYKHDADKISLKDFRATMEIIRQKYSKKRQSILEVTSPDTYYTNDKDEFIRYRDSQVEPELTIKSKLYEHNNQDRTELNLPLDLEGLCNYQKDKMVDKFTSLLGFKRNFRIYKTCFIYYIGDLNFVYYIVYNEDMKELRRFVEIEFNEKRAKRFSIEHIYKMLDEYEAQLAPLNIKPRSRLKKSLFEMYKK